jgi:gliding motility-associated-like protein
MNKACNLEYVLKEISAMKIITKTFDLSSFILFFLLVLSAGSNAQIDQLINTTGLYQIRADGCGTNGLSCDIIIEKPVDATTVHQAYIYYSTMPGEATDLGPDVITVTGGGLVAEVVSMTNYTESPSGVFYNCRTRYEDVTALLAPELDAAADGTTISYTVAESEPLQISGVGIVVVWNNPTTISTAIHLSIGSVHTGELHADSIALAPIDTGIPGFAATMGVGTVFSTGDATQRSTIWINEVELDDYVGGYDDGEFIADGQLFTLGGYGDSEVAIDDEYYDFAGWIADGDTQVKYEVLSSTAHDLDWFNAIYFEIVAASPPSDTTICEGDSLLLAGAYQTLPGTYTDTLVSVSGLDSIVTTILTISPLPVIDAGPDTVSCSLTYTLDADDGGDVGVAGAWTGTPGVFSDISSPSSDVTVDAPGIYTFYRTVENALGCVITDSVEITFVTLTLDDAVLTDPVCNGIPDGQIEVTPSGGFEPYTYAWDAAADFQTTNPAVDLGAGTFGLVLTDSSGCTFDVFFVLSEPSPFTYTTSSEATECGLNNGSATIADFAGGEGPYTYDWGFGPGAITTITDLFTGSYDVLVTDANGCDTTITIEVGANPAFTASIASFTNVTCNGFADGTATAEGSDATATYSYQWDAAADNQTTATAVGLDVGTYWVVITDDGSGCTDSVSVDITEPTALTVDAGSDITICEDDVVSVNGTAAGGTPGYTYTWDNDVVDGVDFAPTISGAYEVTATDDNGCEETDNLIIIIHPKPDPSVVADVQPCEFGATFTNTTPGTIVDCVWLIDGVTVTGCGPINYTFPGAGTYDISLTTTTDEGCVNSVNYPGFVTYVPLPEANFYANPSSVSELNPAVNFINTSTGAVSYDWDFGDMTPGSNSENPTHTYPKDVAEVYEVMLIATSSDGCIDTAYRDVEVMAETIFYVPNTFTPDGDDFNEQFTPVFTSGFDPYDYHMIIVNRWGEVVFESFNAAYGWDGSYGGEIAQDGMYVWTIDFKVTGVDERRLVQGHVMLLK